MPCPRSRRTVLSLGASALLSLSGCVANDSDSDSPSTTGTETTEKTDGPNTDETTDHSDYRRVEITVNPASPVAVANAVVQQFSDLSEQQRRVVSTSVTDGEYVYTSYVEKPLDETYVAYDGAYYRVTFEVVAERERTSHVFGLDTISNCEHLHDDEELETAREKAIQFEDLPEADKDAFVFTHEDDFREDTCFSAGYHYVYESGSALEQSLLVSEDPTYVEYDDDIYVVEFEKTMPIIESDYRYTSEQVAETKEKFSEVVARDVAIHLQPSDLSPGERELLDEMMDVPAYEKWKNPIPDRVDDLMNRIRSHDAHGDWDQYYVEYRGDYYEFRIREAVA